MLVLARPCVLCAAPSRVSRPIEQRIVAAFKSDRCAAELDAVARAFDVTPADVRRHLVHLLAVGDS